MVQPDEVRRQGELLVDGSGGGSDRERERAHENQAGDEARHDDGRGDPSRGGAGRLRPDRSVSDQALAAVNVTGMVKVAPWQAVTDALLIATPAAVNDREPLAGTVWVTAVVVKVTPVVVHNGWLPSGTAAPFAFTDVMATGNGFGLFTVR